MGDILKNFSLLLICVLIVAGSAFGGGRRNRTAAPVDNSLRKIMGRGTLVIGIDDKSPPMGFRNEANEIQGLVVDLAGEAARRMGLELVFLPIDISTVELELGAGIIDCIWNSSAWHWRNMLFSPPYLLEEQVVVVRDESPAVSFSDLADRYVGTQAPASSVEAHFTFGIRELIFYRDFHAALLDLEVGGIDAVIIGSVAANYHINRLNRPFRILNEVMEGQAMDGQEYRIAFRQGDKALAEKVWEILQEIAMDGTAAGIIAQWLGEGFSVFQPLIQSGIPSP